MGLKLEYKTRRFAMDDRKELQYRVQVQNRAFKKDVEALENEIVKLKKQIESTNVVILNIKKQNLNVCLSFILFLGGRC